MESKDGKPGAIILGGSFHSLGAARNLAQHNVPVCVLDNGPCISRYSRSVKQFILCPSVDDEEAFVEFLVQLSVDRNKEGWVLFPSTDEYVRILSQYREQLSEHFLIAIQSWDIIQHLYDKRFTHRLAEDRGVPIPKTYNPQNINDLTSLGIDFPVIIKPAISKKFMAATNKKAFRVRNEEELINSYRRTASIINSSEILVQELIPGGAENLFSFVGFFKNGNPVAGMSAKRSRQHPMDFGRASTFVESVDISELETLAAQLLGGIGFSGLAEIEFMYDQKDAQFELLEVNPRIWGWLTIVIQAGLDLPYLAFADAVGKEIAPNPISQDVKWVRLITDIPTVFLEILAGKMTLRQYRSSMSGNLGFAVLSRTDPLPFIADLFLCPYNYFNRRGF
jgi:predicted ATP-grasp superfamily ATP-dependent carboligase